MLCIENGLGKLDVPHFELYQKGITFNDVIDAFGVIYENSNEFETVVVDSLDWLEPLVWAETCRRNNWKTIEQPDFGRGYLATIDVWKEYIEAVNALRDDKNIAVIQLAHAVVNKTTPPDSEPSDRYEIKLHKLAKAKMIEHCDALLFANYRTSTVKSDVGFKKTVTRGVGRGERLIFTEERPAFLAKCRYPLPDQIDMSLGYAELVKAVAS
ncbi:ATP-binding protein (plasmid) [Azospirillum sp. HJ39]|uniref:ATP-binding protein n=1 Tax=Azospirillum sp. HJ39 TaxID=3159496 RepID=UPI003556370B